MRGRIQGVKRLSCSDHAHRAAGESVAGRTLRSLARIHGGGRGAAGSALNSESFCTVLATWQPLSGNRWLDSS